MGFLSDKNVVDPGNVSPRQSQSSINAGIKQQYQVVITVGEGNANDSFVNGVQVFPLVAALPERYSIGVSSMWDAPFANKSFGDRAGGGDKGAFIDTSLGTLGIGTRNKYQMGQVWQQSSPISFNLDLVFNAHSNTKTDIMYKHLGLLKLALPSEDTMGTGTLFAPGPNLISKTLGGRNISLQLGTYLLMENVIVKSVSSDIQTLCGEDGIPHSMTINVEFETFYSGVTTTDLEKMFMKLG